MRASASAASGAFADGFSTTVFPAMSAGAIFHAAMRIGTFHGTIAATTPNGSRRVYENIASPSGTVSPFSSPPRPPK
jgi:hypothetical protein